MLTSTLYIYSCTHTGIHCTVQKNPGRVPPLAMEGILERRLLVKVYNDDYIDKYSDYGDLGTVYMTFKRGSVDFFTLTFLTLNMLADRRKYLDRAADRTKKMMDRIMLSSEPLVYPRKDVAKQ
jgi:hypothetical protein